MRCRADADAVVTPCCYAMMLDAQRYAVAAAAAFACFSLLRCCQRQRYCAETIIMIRADDESDIRYFSLLFRRLLCRRRYVSLRRCQCFYWLLASDFIFFR